MNNNIADANEDLIKEHSKKLNDLNPKIRIKAADAIANIKGINTTAYLLNALNDHDPETVTNAALILGDLKSSEAVEPLIKVLGNEDPDIKKYASQALGKIQDVRAVEPLISALNEENDYVRRNMALALDRIGGEKTAKRLITVLREGNEYEKAGAALALGEMKCVEAERLLIDNLKHKSENVRMNAARALDKIKPKERKEDSYQHYIENQPSSFKEHFEKFQEDYPIFLKSIKYIFALILFLAIYDLSQNQNKQFLGNIYHLGIGTFFLTYALLTFLLLRGFMISKMRPISSSNNYAITTFVWRTFVVLCKTIYLFIFRYAFLFATIAYLFFATDKAYGLVTLASKTTSYMPYLVMVMDTAFSPIASIIQWLLPITTQITPNPETYIYSYSLIYVIDTIFVAAALKYLWDLFIRGKILELADIGERATRFYGFHHHP